MRAKGKGVWRHGLSVTVVFAVGALALPVHAAIPRRADVNIFGEGGLIELPRATLLGDNYYSFGAWTNYFYDGGQQAFRASPVSFGLGLPKRLEVAFSFSATAPDDPWRRAGEVQFRAALKYAFMQEPSGPVGLAMSLRLENALSRPDLAAFAMLDRHLGKRLGLISVAGFRFGTDRSRPDQFVFGAGAEYRINHKGVAQLEFELDVAPTTGISGVAGRVSFRWNIFKHLGLALIVGGGGLGQPSFRVMFGLRYQPTGTGLADADGDGIPDERDSCPDDPEDRDGWLDTDGCPDPDNDGDGIPDKLDPTPNGALDAGLHKGPVRMRMRIPQGPVPTWIMRRRERQKSETEAVPSSTRPPEVAP